MPTYHEIVIQKRECPEEMPSGLYIKYAASPFENNVKEITEKSLKQILKKIRNGKKLGIYLTQNPDMEDDNYMILEVNKELITFCYIENEGTENACFYTCFNPDYLDSEEEAPIDAMDGQSIILMRYTTRDSKLAAKCVEYFVRTGKLYPGADWLKGWTDWKK